MKKIILGLFLFITQISTAQRYDLTQTVVPFVPLNNATILNLPPNWDDEQATLELPFGYSFYGYGPVDSIFITTNALMSNINLEAELLPQEALVFFGGNYDLVQKENTTVSYKIDGVAPFRKLTVEFLNAGFFGLDPELGNLNIQNTITEDGCFSIHLGSVLTPDSSDVLTGAIFGIFSAGRDSLCYALAEGTALNYTEGLGVATLESDLPYLNIFPGENNLIEFCPRNTLSTSEIEEVKISVFPNPAKDALQLRNLKNISIVELYNLTGKLVKQFNTCNTTELISIEDLSEGVYFIRCTSMKGKTETLKLVKQ